MLTPIQLCHFEIPHLHVIRTVCKSFRWAADVCLNEISKVRNHEIISARVLWFFVRIQLCHIQLYVRFAWCSVLPHFIGTPSSPVLIQSTPSPPSQYSVLTLTVLRSHTRNPFSPPSPPSLDSAVVTLSANAHLHNRRKFATVVKSHAFRWAQSVCNPPPCAFPVIPCAFNSPSKIPLLHFLTCLPSTLTPPARYSYPSHPGTPHRPSTLTPPIQVLLPQRPGTLTPPAK